MPEIEKRKNIYSCQIYGKCLANRFKKEMYSNSLIFFFVRKQKRTLSGTYVTLKLLVKYAHTHSHLSFPDTKVEEQFLLHLEQKNLMMEQL